MTAPTNANPALSNTLTGYDPTGHQEGVAIQVGTLVQDATTGVWYAPVQTTGGGGGVQYTDGGTPPANPIGSTIVWDNSGAWVDVGADHPLPISGTFWQTTQPISAASLPLPSNAAQETGGNLATIAGAISSAKAQINNAQVSGTATSVNAGNRDAGTQRFIEAGNGTGTVTQVASSASSGVILAANTNKKGTLFYNDSTATLYLLYGTGTASTTNYSVKIGSQAYFEDPLHYTGGFNGIWASANGFVYCTEVS